MSMLEDLEADGTHDEKRLFHERLGRLLSLGHALRETAMEVGLYLVQPDAPVEELVAAISQVVQLPQVGPQPRNGRPQAQENSASEVPTSRDDGSAVWLMNSYNVLEHWGFYIHAGMDAESHYVLWLEISISKSPEAILRHYQRAIHRFGMPFAIQAGNGPENRLVKADIQTARGAQAFTTGTTQKMGQFWRLLKKQSIQYYLWALGELDDRSSTGDSDFDLGNPLHRASLHRVFLPRLRKSLDDWACTSNIQRVRKCTSREGESRPSFVPSREFCEFRELDEVKAPSHADSEEADEAVWDVHDLSPQLRSVREFIFKAMKQRFKELPQPRGTRLGSAHLSLVQESNFHLNLTLACKKAERRGLV